MSAPNPVSCKGDFTDEHGERWYQLTKEQKNEEDLNSIVDQLIKHGARYLVRGIDKIWNVFIPWNDHVRHWHEANEIATLGVD